MKLLVVEDELYAREALVRQIKKYDVTHVFEIYQAANGAEGWEICQKEDPELVLTDIRMPKMMVCSCLNRSGWTDGRQR